MKNLAPKNIVIVSEECGISLEWIVKMIENEWITPADPQGHHLDEEDVARIRLIRELSEEFEVNEEAIPIILELVDKVYILRKWLKDSNQQAFPLD